MERRARVEQKLLELLSSEKLAKKVEVAIYNHTIQRCKERGVHCQWENRRFLFQYRSKVYSIYWNLKYTPPLLQRLLRGDLGVRKLVGMTRYDMKPELWAPFLAKRCQRMNEDATYKLADDYVSLIPCRFCRQVKTVWTTVQTRSADEPSTVFVLCTVCHRRFRTV